MKRRLRLDEVPHARVWEISVEGSRIILRTGLEHTPGSVRRIERASPEAAQKTARQMIEQRLADGFHDAPLEAWEALTPDGPSERWLVYADTLLAQGDPRGELIALQARGEAKKAKALLRREADALLGDLAGVLNQVELEWNLGFISTARITSEPRRRHSVPLHSMLTPLFNSPSIRMLQRLELEWPGGHFNSLDYGLSLLVLCTLQWPAHLDTLEIGAFDPSEVRRWPSLNTLKPLERYPQLKYLVVRAAMTVLDLDRHDGLRHLELDGPAMTHRMLADLLVCQLPALRGLVLSIGAESVMSARHLTPLASPLYFPNLAALGIRQCRQVTTFAARLIDEGRLARLSLLDLSENSLNEPDGRWLLENASHFAHLSRLVLRANRFKPRMRARLAEALPNADLSGQL